MMRNESVRELFEDRENDWLAEERKYERRVRSAFDVNEGHLLKEQHVDHCEVKEIANEHERVHSQATARSKSYTSQSYKSAKPQMKKANALGTIFVVLFVLIFVFVVISQVFSVFDEYGYIRYRILDIIYGLFSMFIPLVIFIAIVSSIIKAVKKNK